MKVFGYITASQVLVSHLKGGNADRLATDQLRSWAQLQKYCSNLQNLDCANKIWQNKLTEGLYKIKHRPNVNFVGKIF